MPGHGGGGHGGGGGHHGGGGGGGHHGGGGRFRGGGGGGWGWGPGWYGPWGDPSYSEIVVTCPNIYAPVLATDGRTYDNECLARDAGTSVVKRMPANLSGLGSVIGAVPDSVLLLGVIGALAWWYTKRR